MQCLVLAGGLGTRMQAISNGAPKALLPVGPKLFIDWQLMWLKKIGITDVVLALGHGSEAIVDYIEAVQANKDYPQVNYSFDGDKLMGTGGAIRRASKLLSNDFYVTYGDTIVFLNATKLAQAHMSCGKAMTMSILHNKNEADASNVKLVDGGIYYDKFNSKPDMEYIDYGMSVVNKDYFLKHTPKDTAFDFATFTHEASVAKQVQGFPVTTFFQEVGSPAGYTAFCNLLAEKNYDLDTLYKEKV